MRKIVVLLAVALFVGAILADSAWAQYGIYGQTYSKPVRIYCGNDSLYKVGNRDSTQLVSAWNAASGATVVNTNWLDISELAVPHFKESYADSGNNAITIAKTELRFGHIPEIVVTHENNIREYGSFADSSWGAVVDSLSTYARQTYADTTTLTETRTPVNACQPIGMRITAWVTSGHANVDTVSLRCQVSMDKIGYVTVAQDFIEPSHGTTAMILGDSDATARVFNIPAGKLYGWKWMRIQASGDNNHEQALGIKLYHWFALYQPIPDWDEPR